MDSQTDLSRPSEETLKSLGYPLSEVSRDRRPWPQLRGAAAVVYGGHIQGGNVVPDPWDDAILFQPGPEDLRMHYGLPPIPPRNGRFRPSPAQAGPGTGAIGGSGARTLRPVTAGERAASTPQEEPGEILSRSGSVQRSGFRQREFLADGRVAGRIASRRSPERRSPGGAAAAVRREPEAIYQFLVRKNRIRRSSPRRKPHVRFRGRDRLRTGSGRPAGFAIGEVLGTVTQGLTPRIQELFGTGRLPVVASPAGRGAQESLLLAVARSSCRRSPRPGRTAGTIARGPPGRPPASRDSRATSSRAGSRARRRGKRPESMPRPCLPRAAPRRELPEAQAGGGILVSLTHTTDGIAGRSRRRARSRESPHPAALST